MADDARKKTDKRLAEMEAELTKIYQKSAKVIYSKWSQYMAEAELKKLSSFIIAKIKAVARRI